MTNHCEQESVRDYCHKREIVRPKTNILFVLKYLFFLEVLIFVLYFFVDYLLVWFGISVTFSVLFFFVSALVLLLNSKRISILFIELYQHYASEQTRRRCTLKPSCSEYAILAIKKYGIIKGLYKAYNRLFIVCKGNVYRIDYP
ncbi:MAG: membrane protein insertion efficiency factor YidD [Bacteroidota bacterium]